MTTTILLARHGETDWNRDNRFQGHADPPLNAAGREQARRLAAALAQDPPAAIYASPLRRALETADIVARELGLPVATREELREVDVGEWTGLTRTEVEQRYPDQFRRWVGFGRGWEDGETYEQLAERVLPALREIAWRHAGNTILVVAHGGTLRVVQAELERVDYGEARRRRRATENCGVWRVAVEDGAVRRVD